MNKILIHRGDCTIFANAKKFLTFYIDTDLDLTGWTAEFTLYTVKKTVTDISNKQFEIILGANDTKELKLGTWNGVITLTDADGNIKTVINTIPFEVTKEVVENQYQEIDLTIPESSGVDIKLKVGVEYVTPDKLEEQLATKQDKGNYALKSDLNNLATKEEIPTLVSELENDSNFATQLQVMQAIASIPQFKLSIVNELPMIGEKMTLYFVPKEGADNDIYNEYVWIEQTSSYEFLGSTAVDLTDYVTKTEFNTTIGDIGTILDSVIGE